MAKKSKRIKIDGLADEIMNSLKEYEDVTVEDLVNIGKEVAKEGVKILKKTSPEGAGSKKGHYKDGWAVRTKKPSKSKSSNLIHNKKKPGLTHLLENGHAKRDGGKTKAIPHIKPVEEYCIEQYSKRVEEKLKQ